MYKEFGIWKYSSVVHLTVLTFILLRTFGKDMVLSIVI